MSLLSLRVLSVSVRRSKRGSWVYGHLFCKLNRQDRRMKEVEGEFLLISLQPNNNTIFKEDILTGPPPHSILNSLKIILKIKNVTKNLPLPYILSTLKVRKARKLRKIPIVSEIVRLIDVYLLKMVDEFSETIFSRTEEASWTWFEK